MVTTYAQVQDSYRILDQNESNICSIACGFPIFGRRWLVGALDVCQHTIWRGGIVVNQLSNSFLNIGSDTSNALAMLMVLLAADRVHGLAYLR